jgi:hypothetical protein
MVCSEEWTMFAMLTVSSESLTHPPSLQKLRRMAADHELVLVCGQDSAATLVGVVRTLLPRHRVVAMLIDSELFPHERDLLDEILNDGHLPVICTVGDPNSLGLKQWMDADAAFELAA